MKSFVLEDRKKNKESAQCSEGSFNYSSFLFYILLALCFISLGTEKESKSYWMYLIYQKSCLALNSFVTCQV